MHLESTAAASHEKNKVYDNVYLLDAVIQNFSC